MINIEHKNKNGMHSFYIWDHTGWVDSLLPTSDFEKGKYNAHQIALKRQGELKIVHNITADIKGRENDKR